MPRKVKKQPLVGIQEGRSAAADSGQDAVADEELGFHINKEYARRFEHNKQREELHRLQEKHGRGGPKITLGDSEADVTPSSDDEEEDDGNIPEEQEAAILDTLLRIKRHDPLIYKPEVHFFEGIDQDSEVPAVEVNGAIDSEQQIRSKPLYLKDVLARQVLEHGPELSSSEDEEGGGKRARLEQTRQPRVYDAEQEQLRQAFLSAVQEDGAEAGDPALGGVLRKKRRGEETALEEEIGGQREDAPGDGAAKKRRKGKAGKPAPVEKLAQDFFGADEGALDEGDRFLKKFILQRGWVDANDQEEARHCIGHRRHTFGEDDDADGDQATNGSDSEEGATSSLAEDEEFLEETDRYEAAYNFRFEEPGAARLYSHPRNVEGTVRKEDDRRKRQRQARAERQAEEAARVEEEVKRLKNLKKKDIEDRLSKIRRVAGLKEGGSKAVADSAIHDILAGDFDPDAWDRHMATAFGDDYYQEEDEEVVGQENGTDMALESEDDDLAGGGDEEGFKALHKKIMQAREREAAAPTDEGSAAQAAAQRASLQQLVQEYYQLDYEDSVGGVRTRFRYKEVPASNYGLAVQDILALEDKDLNQVVGLKRLAPYREDAGKDRPNYKALQAITAAGSIVGAATEKRGGRKHRPKPTSQQHQQRRGWQQQGSTVQGVGGRLTGRSSQKHTQKPAAPLPAEARVAGPAGPAAPVVGNGVPKQPVGQNKWKASGLLQAKQANEEAAKAARLASYSKLTLKKDGPSSNAGGGNGSVEQKKARRSDVDKPKAVVPAGVPADTSSAVDGGPALSKAAKKNAKRALKRAAQYSS